MLIEAKTIYVMPFWNGIMEEIEFKLRNKTVFSEISREFPDMTILRWCSSVIDYVEVYGDPQRSTEVKTRLMSATKDLKSQIVSAEIRDQTVSAAISCRCTVENSTIRLAEKMNLLWVAPAKYSDGYEMIRLISFSPEDTMKFYTAASRIGDVEIQKKTTIEPDSLRRMYTISLNEVFTGFSTKQLIFLRDAVSMGLFSTPRKIMVEDLARSKGVSKSTMQEHLNKAKNKLMKSLEPYINLFLDSNTSEN
ncbi:MAG: helix-turn-helix domain-containing protein [Thermoplasmataceae archaeon]